MVVLLPVVLTHAALVGPQLLPRIGELSSLLALRGGAFTLRGGAAFDLSIEALQKAVADPAALEELRQATGDPETMAEVSARGDASVTVISAAYRPHIRLHPQPSSSTASL